MPGPHAHFLEHLSSTAIRNFVMSHSASHSISEDYNSAIATLTAFRDKHIKIVTRYIILPSKAPPLNRPKMRNLNLAIASTLKHSNGLEKPALQGTGGTKLMPFLKQTRDETKEVAIYEK